MDYETLYEDLMRVLEDLTEKNRSAPIIVEGDRDRRALRALGVRGEIATLNRGATLFAQCEAIAREHREAIILTDWDAKGGRLARQLRDGLAANDVRYDDDLRARLTGLCRREIKDVESLHAYVARIREILEGRDRQKPSHRYYSDGKRRWRRYHPKRRNPPDG